MKVSELTGPLLDYWAAKSIGMRYAHIRNGVCFAHKTCNASAASKFSPSADWAQGGSIIEREKITIYPETYTNGELWFAEIQTLAAECGATPLIAAIRCYVASKLGEEVTDDK